MRRNRTGSGQDNIGQPGDVMVAQGVRTRARGRLVEHVERRHGQMPFSEQGRIGTRRGRVRYRQGRGWRADRPPLPAPVIMIRGAVVRDEGADRDPDERAACGGLGRLPVGVHGFGGADGAAGFPVTHDPPM